MVINDELLKSFITTFYGSGNYEGQYWFVGMEEGGGNSLDQVAWRINTWHELGGTELVDIYKFHIKINHPEYFTNPVKLQRTWMQMARIILASKGLSTSVSDIKDYQRDIIGRKKSETCLLELLPLPSPNTATWQYSEWSSLPYLKNREIYRNYCSPWRCEQNQSHIKTFQPKAVVFMGSGYSKYWQSIIGENVVIHDKGGFGAAKLGKTLFVIAKHPAARGIENNYFENIGWFIRSSQ